MKKNSLARGLFASFFFTFLLSSTIFSQTKNQILIGGYFDASITKVGNISPVFLKDIHTDIFVGRYLKDGFALGVKLPNSIEIDRFFRPGIYRIQTGMNPFAQFHPFPDNDLLDLFFWVETGPYFLFARQADFSDPLSSFIPFIRFNNIDWNFGGGIGANYFITSNLAISGRILLQETIKLKSEQLSEYPNFSFKVGVVGFIDRQDKD